MLALCIESSHARGLGHLFRALRLADALKARGVNCQFLVNQHGPALELLARNGYRAVEVDLNDLSTNWEKVIIRRDGIRLWVNDRLNTTAQHAQHIKSVGIPLVTFDDRGDGAVLADLHIAALIFDDHVPLSGRRILKGVKYLILDPAISKYRRPRTEPGSTVISLGGSDTYGVTVKIVSLLAERGQQATVIVGPAFAHHAELSRVMTPGFILKQSVPSLAEEFSRHNLAITGGGVTPFEANAAGLPCIVVANETFEIQVGQALERMGGSVFAGYHEAIDTTVFDRQLPIASMSRSAMERIDLEGAQRVTQAILELWGSK